MHSPSLRPGRADGIGPVQVQRPRTKRAHGISYSPSSSSKAGDDQCSSSKTDN